MGAIRNFVLDMGNVLFDYNPGAMTEYFLPAAPEEDKERFLKEFFSGSEWIDRDLGIISEEEMYQSVSKRLPPRLHESLRNCLQSWLLCICLLYTSARWLRQVHCHYFPKSPGGSGGYRAS